jgi:oxaloacetate decarboxylase (Na+ extruding) subunit alpha
MEKIKINDITIREIFQNAEVQHIDIQTFDMILNHLNDIQYDSLEILGGSGFERILESNFNLTPLGLISYIKNKIPSIPLQILIGARNLGGLEVYSNDIINKFVRQSVRNGVDIFRVYDSLNDLDNLKYTISTIIENKASCQGTIIYDSFKDIDFYLGTAKELEKQGCSSICIKDAESIILPGKTGRLFEALSSETGIPVFLSTSNLRNLQIPNYFEACRKGCGGIDLSFLPSSYSDCNHTIFSFILSLKDEDISHNLEHSKLIQLNDIIKRYIYPLIKQDLFTPGFILDSSNKNLLPGWLISSINHQLAEIGELDAMDSVLEEVFKIKNEIGNPTLATPIGQIIGSQAILNAVISDSRWDILCDEIKKLIWGYFGKLPGKVNKKILGKLESTPDNNIKSALREEDTYEQCKNELINFSDKEDDILSYCFYPEKTRKLLEKKKAGLRKSHSVKGSASFVENINFRADKSGSMAKLENLDIRKLREITSLVENSNIEDIKLEVDGVKISINNPRHRSEEFTPAKEEISGSQEEKSTGLIEVKSPIVGIFYSSAGPDSPPFVKIGDRVKNGDTLCIIEAMKLMNKITSDCDGKIIDIPVSNEEAVEFDQTLIIIKKEEK